MIGINPTFFLLWFKGKMETTCEKKGTRCRDTDCTAVLLSHSTIAENNPISISHYYFYQESKMLCLIVNAFNTLQKEQEHYKFVLRKY